MALENTSNLPGMDLTAAPVMDALAPNQIPVSVTQNILCCPGTIETTVDNIK